MTDHPVFAPDMLVGLHLLEADAGTGKTWTLTGLVVRALLERDLSIDAILAVTFTKAAAAELRSRCRLRIVDMLAALEEGAAPSPDPFIAGYAERLRDGQVSDAHGVIVDPVLATARLQLALSRSNELAAYTLHGFCQRLLSSQPLLSGAPPELSPGAQTGPAIESAIRDWWRTHLAPLPFEEARLLAGLGLSLSGLMAGVSACLADPQAQLQGADVDWRRALRQAAAGLPELAALVRRERDQIQAWADAGRKGPANFDGVRMRKATVSRNLDRLERLDATDARFEWPREELEYFSSAKLSSLKANMALVGQNPLPRACDDWLEIYDNQLNPIAGALVVEALQAVRQALAASLFASGNVSFDDLVRLTHEALADPGNGARLAASLRASYPFALVDECQDTDPLQWAILQAIWPMANDGAADPPCGLVLVGDPKQSIYRFRGADVHAYLDARQGWGLPDDNRAVSRPRPKISRLSENQRSDIGVINAVNDLFKPAGSFLVDEIRYDGSSQGDRRRSHFESAARPSRGAFCWVQWNFDAAPDVDTVAAACAREILALLSDSDNRIDGVALRPQDIAVLVNRNDEGLAVKARLRELGLSAVETTRQQVMASVEARELLAIVAAIVEPGETPLLRGALATRFIDVPLAGIDDHLVAQAMRFEEARVDWLRQGPRAALQRLFHDHDVPARLAATATPERALTNFSHMLDLLCAQPETRLSAAAGLRWLRRVVIQEESPDAESEELELRLETDQRLIRIMTLHKSKGLEFPVVFVPFCWKAPRPPTAGPVVRFHRRSAALRDTEDAKWRSVTDLHFNHPQAALQALADEEFAERLRLVYVAFTRAKHRCYVFGPALQAAAPARPSALDHLLSLQSSDERSDGLANLTRLDISDLLDERIATAVQDEAPTAGLQLAVSSRALERVLQVSSFTALMRSAWHESDVTATDAGEGRSSLGEQPSASGRDRDEGTATDWMSDPAAQTSGSIRFSFPAGAQPGTCLHRILELADFGQAVDPALVARVLSDYGLSTQPAASVADWLNEVLATRLPGADLSLDSLARSDRLSELEFDLRVDGFDAQAFAERVGREEPVDLQLPSRRWSGYLRGYIDLVFRRRNRYFILDWKSNWLGPAPHDYAPNRLVDSVRDHGYAVQYSLYLVALHRHLRARLPDYDPARHLGGVCYLYVRGVGADARQLANGVHYRPADPELLLDLDRLLVQ